MRFIGKFDDKKRAEHFAAYLKTEKVTAHLELEEETQAWELWVKEEDHLKKSLAAFEEFKSDPNSAQFKGVVEKARALVRDEEKHRAKVQKNIVKVSHNANAKKSTLTVMTIVLCAIVALISNFGDSKSGAPFRALSFNGISTEHVEVPANDNFDSVDYRLSSIRQGHIWRLITPIFIHFGVFHLVFNMWMFFQFGQIIENRYGTFWLAVMILGIAAISNFAQGVVPNDWGGSVPINYLGEGFLISTFGGMSGVVYGLFGFVWMKTIFDPNCRIFLSQLTVLILIGWLFFCMMPEQSELTGIHVANWAHGVGLAAGMAIGYLSSMGKS